MFISIYKNDIIRLKPAIYDDCLFLDIGTIKKPMDRSAGFLHI